MAKEKERKEAKKCKQQKAKTKEPKKLKPASTKNPYAMKGSKFDSVYCCLTVTTHDALWFVVVTKVLNSYACLCANQGRDQQFHPCQTGMAGNSLKKYIKTLKK